MKTTPGPSGSVTEQQAAPSSNRGNAWSVLLVLRAAGLVFLVGYLLVNPVLSQFVFEKAKTPYLHTWALYHYPGSKLCMINVVRVDPEVGDVQTSRHELAGLTSWQELPKSRQKIRKGGGNIGRELRTVCKDAKKQHGKDVLIRAEIRCGDSDGWDDPRVAPNVCSRKGRRLRSAKK